MNLKEFGITFIIVSILGALFISQIDKELNYQDNMYRPYTVRYNK